ncbi:MAG: DUF2961 domain-containing protein, partial [Planctomycetota bacterium]
AWGQGRYDNQYQGCHIADRENMQYGFYRWHIPDAIYFREDIRVTIHQIGCWGPESKKDMIEAGVTVYKAGPGLEELDLAKQEDEYGLFERADDWSSCAYFYLERPVNELGDIDGLEKRMVELLRQEGQQREDIWD